MKPTSVLYYAAGLLSGLMAYGQATIPGSAWFFMIGPVALTLAAAIALDCEK